MHRICGTLASAGYTVTLIGRKMKGSKPLQKKSFGLKRIICFFNKGFAFYAEYNTRLFLYLLTKKIDCICAIDLDTILPCLFISQIKKTARVYDAHEYFTELKEVHTRPVVQKFWLAVEKFALPKFKNGYTVSDGLAQAFLKKYQRNFIVIRNLPVLVDQNPVEKKEKVLFYGGAVNEGRGFEFLIPALKKIPYRLLIAGDGNFMTQLKSLILKSGVEDKIDLKGMQTPTQLRRLAQQCFVGIALAEKEGLNQLMALPNKFFEYMHAGLPQVAMNYPEYAQVNDNYAVAVLIDTLEPEVIASTVNQLMDDVVLLETLTANCVRAKKVYCWQNEEQKLIEFYNQILPVG